MNFCILQTEVMICPCCMEEHSVQTISMEEQTIFKKEPVNFRAEYYYCDRAEEYYADEAMMKQNDIRMKDTYRESQGLLTSEEIRRIREKYAMSQRDFCILLGWGEKTMTRYEGHQVQDRAHDIILKKLDQDPEWFLQLLMESKRNFSRDVLQKYKERAEAMMVPDS